MLKRINMDKIDNTLNYIFSDDSWKNNNNKFEKRKIIYDYIVNEISYDWQSLKNILSKDNNVKRDYYKDIIDVLDNNKGVCHGISYVYKMMLSRIGIYSLTVVVNEKADPRCKELKKITNESKIQHMLVLVKNEDNTFSFDDPTSEIIMKNNMKIDIKDEFFNYGLEKIKVFKQELLGVIPSNFLEIMLENRVCDLVNERKYESKWNNHNLICIPNENIIKSFN